MNVKKTKDDLKSAFYDNETFKRKYNTILKNLHEKTVKAYSDLNHLMMESKVSPQQAAVLRDKIQNVHAVRYVLLLSNIDFDK